MMGTPDDYKTERWGANYYPSDCLSDWRYSTINKDGQIIDYPMNHPEEVAGITCKGIRYCNDAPQEITVMFKDL